MKCVTRNLFFFIILFSPLCLFAQGIPNAGFEIWNGNVPEGWMPNNTDAVTQSSDAHDGSYSVQLQILENISGLYGGKIDAGNNGMGFDYFQRPDKLTCFYKLNPQVGDHLWLDVWLYKDGGTTLVGHGQEAVAQPTSTWTEVSANISYILPDFPDRCQIQIFIGLGLTQEDSGKVWVDDLQFQFTNAVEEISGNIPNDYELMQNYPNPFNPTTNIEFALPQYSYVNLAVYNTLGELVETLISEELNAGTYNYDWTAEGLPSGIYFYSIIAGKYTDTKKLVLMK